MNLQVTELKMGKVEAAKIEWNGPEIKASLNVALEDYRNLVVTEDMVKGSKEIMSELNKQAKAIDDFRKSTVKQLNPDIKAFEAEAKELVIMIKEARELIKCQVETFIERQREEKRELVNCRIDALDREYELEEEFKREIEFKDQYLNSSLSINKVEQDLRIQYDQAKQLQDMKHQKIDTIKVIVETFNHQLRFKFTPQEFDYLLDQDISQISKVVNEKVQGRIQEEKAELERIEAEKQAAIEQAKKDEEERVRKEEEQKRLASERESERLRQEEIRKQEQIRLEEQRKHEAELRAKELEATEKQRELQEQQAKVLETVTKQTEAFTPVENEKSRKLKVQVEIKATKEQMQALKAYMDQYDIEYTKL